MNNILLSITGSIFIFLSMLEAAVSSEGDMLTITPVDPVLRYEVIEITSQAQVLMIDGSAFLKRNNLDDFEPLKIMDMIYENDIVSILEKSHVKLLNGKRKIDIKTTSESKWIVFKKKKQRSGSGPDESP